MSDDLSLPQSEREMYTYESRICELTKDKAHLEKIVESQSDEIFRLVKQVVALREMRDMARREICMISCGKGGRSSSVSPDAIEEAKRRGWDCFDEENTP